MRRKLALLLLVPFLLGAAPQAGQIRRVYNLTLTSAGTEYSQTLTGNVYQITVQARSAVAVRMAVSSGETSLDEYWTIKSGGVYYEQIISAGDITLYFQDPSNAGTIIEIVAWSNF